jgi:hypothetical protein
MAERTRNRGRMMELGVDRGQIRLLAASHHAGAANDLAQ